MHIFIKTLKDESVITLVFCIILALTIFLIIQEFAIARHLDFSALIDKVPGPLKKIAETFLVLSVFGGYLHIIASVDWIIISGIFVSLVSASLISREAEKKTLGLLIAHPVSRFSIISQKYFAFIIYLIIISLFSFLGFYLGIYHGVINVPYSMKIIARTIFNGFAFFFALSALGLLFSVFFSEQKKASIATMLYFFLSYLAFFLGAFSPRWALVKKLTLFQFFNTEALLFYGKFNLWNCIFLFIIGIILYILAVVIFYRKDIST